MIQPGLIQERPLQEGGAAVIGVEGLCYAPGGTTIIDGLDLTVELGKVTALVGRSGCGKSTLLRQIAGLRPHDRGAIHGVPGRKAFVFQDAALLPWRTAAENVALPGAFGAIGEVEAALGKVGLGGLGGRLPGALSGGQKMRVSLARALVARPEIVFLDEAFAALDGVTRRDIQRTFLSLQEEAGWTVILVTHELHDAVALSDRVLALDGPPLKVLADIPVPVRRPRTLADPEILAVVQALEGVFWR